MTKSILINKRTSIPNIKLYYRVIVIKSAWHWYRHRQVDQWNRIEDPEMNEHTYGPLIFHKFQQMVLDQLAVDVWENAIWSILISLYKAQVQVD